MWTSCGSCSSAGPIPTLREAGDNTYPLHWAAAGAALETVRALLDAGGDVHGVGDVHLLDAIGWAAYYPAEDGNRDDITRSDKWFARCSPSAARVTTSSRPSPSATSI